MGGYGIKLGTQDITKLGQLHLQKGKWIEQATSKQVPNDQESHAKIGVGRSIGTFPSINSSRYLNLRYTHP